MDKISNQKIIALVLAVVFILSLVFGCIVSVFIFLEGRTKGGPYPPSSPPGLPGNIHNPSSASPSTAYQNIDGSLSIYAKLGNDKLSTQDRKSYLLLAMEGLEIEDSQIDKNPLNISFVIDKSGSMDGEKLESVKKALQEIGTMLSSEDIVSIIVYDDEVEIFEVFAPEGYMFNNRIDCKDSSYSRVSLGCIPSLSLQVYSQQRWDQAISKISSGGSTNLEGGLRTGIDLVKSYQGRDGFISKIILLSDGLANVGISDAQALGAIAESASASISVSTIGVGADYDEKIMTSIARSGRGNYYFMETANQAESIFIKELLSTQSIVASDIQVNLELNENFKLVRNIGYTDEVSQIIRPNDIYSGKKSVFVFEIEAFDLDKYAQSYTLVELDIEYLDITTGRRIKASIPINVQIVDYEINPLADDEVYAQYMDLYKSDVLWSVYDQLDQVNNQSAKLYIDQLIIDLQSANIRLNGSFDTEVEELEEKQKYLENLAEDDINRTEEGREFQKSNQYDSYEKKYNK